MINLDMIKWVWLIVVELDEDDGMYELRMAF